MRKLVVVNGDIVDDRVIPALHDGHRALVHTDGDTGVLLPVGGRVDLYMNVVDVPDSAAE